LRDRIIGMERANAHMRHVCSDVERRCAERLHIAEGMKESMHLLLLYAVIQAGEITIPTEGLKEFVDGYEIVYETATHDTAAHEVKITAKRGASAD